MNLQKNLPGKNRTSQSNWKGIFSFTEMKNIVFVGFLQK